MYEINSLQTWKKTGEWVKPHWRKLARVAVEAMREPTEAMIDVVKYDEYDWGANNWRAMIDKALEE